MQSAIANVVGNSFLYCSGICSYRTSLGWLVGCFGFNGPLRQYFSLYRAVSQRGEKEERKKYRRVKMSKQPPPARNRPLPYYDQNCRTPRYCKFTLDHSTTRPPPNFSWRPNTYFFKSQNWLVGCFWFNGPLRQYFSLYRAVSQREREREEKR